MRVAVTLAALSAACASTGASARTGTSDAASWRGDDAGAADALQQSDAGSESIPKDDGTADTPGGQEAGGCNTLPLCDDFESDSPGAPPAGWAVVMGCNPNTQDTAVDGGLLVGVDATQHHGGRNSLRVVGGDSCGYYAVETSAFASLSSQIYARFWVMFSTGPTQGHNGFLSMATTGGDHFRLGFQDDVVAWNAQKSDATLPDMDPQGTSLSAGATAASWPSWNCVEFHIDETNGHIEFWLNGSSAAIAGLSFDGTNTQGVDDQWARGSPSPAVPANFGLGWLGLNDQETVWFDDVALSSVGRIGCE